MQKIGSEPKTNVASPKRTIGIAAAVLVVILLAGTAGIWYAYRTWVAPYTGNGAAALKEAGEQIKTYGANALELGAEAQEKIDTHVENVKQDAEKAQATVDSINKTKSELETFLDEVLSIFK